MVKNELSRCDISNSAVCALFIVFPAPRFNHELSFLQGHKPVFVETFIPKLSVEALDKGILHRLPWLNEVQMYAVLSRPRIQRRPREFRPVIQNQCLGQRAVPLPGTGEQHSAGQ